FILYPKSCYIKEQPYHERVYIVLNRTAASKGKRFSMDTSLMRSATRGERVGMMLHDGQHGGALPDLVVPMLSATMTRL
ncbi:MAG TPA: hypothetical protein PLE42_12460, partial [Candidatus Competibacteraceae bacterium]|nr:hypothetical protein [Candidatus Competibacteraceae bacterium]HQC73514.1 hypothetical protein [Candidatus Competibacteraceae bacterium]